MPTPALQRVVEAQTAMDAADLALRAIVAEAREANMTWRRIGDEVGISAELARQRWGTGHQAAWRAKRPRSKHLTPVADTPDSPVLQRMVNAYIELNDAHQLLPQAVAAARAGGESWGDIGQALGGISKQAAYQRYGRNPDLPPRAH